MAVPRRNSPKPEDPRPVGGGVGWARAESGPDGDYLVRAISGAQAQKTYRCPGCDHEIPVGLGHEVVVPEQAPELRRHWHTGCWFKEMRRRERAAARQRKPR